MEPMSFYSEHKMVNSSTLWTQSFVFLNLSFFLVFANIAFFYLYPLALDAMGSGHEVIGLVMGLFSVAAVISRPFFGKLVALKGEYRVIYCGMAVSFIASLSYLVITAFGPGMLLIRVVHGIGFSAFISASFSLVARTFPANKRGEAFSAVGASLLSSMALAPPFGELLVHKWGFSALYLAASGSIVLAWWAAFMAAHSFSFSAEVDQKTVVRYLPLLKSRSFVVLLISTLIFAHCQSTVFNFLALITSEKGVQSGRFFFAFCFVAILVLLTVGKLIDRYGKLFFLRFFYPFLSLGILFIPGMIDSSFFLVPAVLYGAGIGILFPTHNALAADHGSQSEKPAIMSLFTAVYDTGFLTGAVVSGWFSAITNLDMLFLITGSLGFLGFFAVLKSK